MISSFAEKESSPLTFLILTDFYLFFFFLMRSYGWGPDTWNHRP